MLLAERVAEPDRIELRGLRLLATIGAWPEEQERRQPVEVDLDVAIDLSVAGRTDQLADTVDYGSVCEAVAEVVAGGRWTLLERLADQTAVTVLAADPRVQEVTVAVRKLRPPVAHDLSTSGVRVTRGRV